MKGAGCGYDGKLVRFCETVFVKVKNSRREMLDRSRACDVSDSHIVVTSADRLLSTVSIRRLPEMYNPSMLT